ncbi:MFS transporter [Ferroplasma sp.]|uniref:MFS transporter n=1 Tax=Ferroplasma sp. TaxID=2591003 RepID=UPI00307FA893
MGFTSNELLQISAAWGGWILDGYTSIAYLLVFSYMSVLIFPKYLGYLAIVLTLLPVTFGAAARSLGSVVLGNFIGDKKGRKNLLSISIVGFSVLSAAIGLLPTYSQAGIASPILLYALLFLDGIFAGAEYGGGTALSMESVRPEKREQAGAFVQSGFGTGYFLIVFVEILLLQFMGTSAFASYGWRILMLTAIIPGMITLVIRRLSHETKIFDEMKNSKEIAKSPAKQMFKNRRNIVFALMITSGLLFMNTATGSFYPVIGSADFLNLGSGLLYALLAINFFSLLGVWTGGILAKNFKDRRSPMIIFSLMFTIPTAIFVLFGYTTNIMAFTIVFSIQLFLEALIFSALPVFLAEAFSKKFRATAIGLIYNGGAIAGGTAIILLTAPAHIINIKTLWIVEMYIAGIILILGLVFYKKQENSGDPIEN